MLGASREHTTFAGFTSRWRNPAACRVSLRQLVDHVRHLRRGQPPAIDDQVGEARPLHQLHDQVGHAAVLACVDGAHDARGLGADQRGDARLEREAAAQLALHRLRQVAVLGVEELDREQAREDAVARQPDRPGGATTEVTDELVLVDPRSGLDRIVSSATRPSHPRMRADEKALVTPVPASPPGVTPRKARARPLAPPLLAGLAGGAAA
jgi:hypothetical protein